MKKLLASLLLALAITPLLTPVTARATEGIGLSPSIQEVQLNEDQKSVNFEVNISNSTNETVDLRLSTLDFGALDESGGIAFIGKTSDETTSYGLSQWMILEKDRLALKPGQTQSVKVTIDNKDNLSPGGHYGAVVVTSVSPGGEQNSSLSVLPAGSTLVLLRKNGGEIQELKLDSINTNKSLIKLPNEVTLRFQNVGNVHLVPRGTVELFGPTGSLISSGIINQQSSFVLPESFRQITVNLDLNGQPWLPGRYKLEVNWRYDGKEEFETTIQYVWYVGKITIFIFITLCLLIVLILFRKWRNNPIIRGK